LARSTRRPGARTRQALRIMGRTRNVPATTPGTVEDHGTVTGTPFGRGSIVLVGRLANQRLTGTFRLLLARGSVTGTVSLPYTIRGNQITFVGTGRLTGGTGAYRGVTSDTLQIRDTNTLPDGQNGRVSVRGNATY
ncbi:MAG TPA: hypothetical protein VGJ70_11395, partial [Solirubrobacteraceae bacterium]